MRVCALRCGFTRVADSRTSSRFAWSCDLGATWLGGIRRRFKFPRGSLARVSAVLIKEVRRRRTSREEHAIRQVARDRSGVRLLELSHSPKPPLRGDRFVGDRMVLPDMGGTYSERVAGDAIETGRSGDAPS
jgi:hypothetical protein